MSYERPPYEFEHEITCRVCGGEDDTCSNCDGDGLEIVDGYEAKQYFKEKEFSDNENRKIGKEE